MALRTPTADTKTLKRREAQARKEANDDDPIRATMRAVQEAKILAAEKAAAAASPNRNKSWFFNASVDGGEDFYESEEDFSTRTDATLTYDELQLRKLSEKRAHFEVKKLRGVPPVRRTSLFWNERNRFFSGTPLPDLQHPGAMERHYSAGLVDYSQEQEEVKTTKWTNTLLSPVRLSSAPVQYEESSLDGADPEKKIMKRQTAAITIKAPLTEFDIEEKEDVASYMEEFMRLQELAEVPTKPTTANYSWLYSFPFAKASAPLWRMGLAPRGEPRPNTTASEYHTAVTDPEGINDNDRHRLWGSVMKVRNEKSIRKQEEKAAAGKKVDVHQGRVRLKYPRPSTLPEGFSPSAGLGRSHRPSIVSIASDGSEDTDDSRPSSSASDAFNADKQDRVTDHKLTKTEKAAKKIHKRMTQVHQAHVLNHQSQLPTIPLRTSNAYHDPNVLSTYPQYLLDCEEAAKASDRKLRVRGYSSPTSASHKTLGSPGGSLGSSLSPMTQSVAPPQGANSFSPPRSPLKSLKSPLPSPNKPGSPLKSLG